MNSTPPFGIGCRIVEEFDDDASKFAEAESEFVPLVAPAGCLAPPASAGIQGTFLVPSEEALATAKQFWLEVIRPFTQPVPRKKNHLRVRDSGEPNRGEIWVEFGRGLHDRDRSYTNRRTGSELDVSDKRCLVLFDKSSSDCIDGKHITERSTPILWTEVVHIDFEVCRVVKPALETEPTD